MRKLQSNLAGPVDLQVPKGQCAAVSGASGSGKTLLLRMIADLDPSTGEALLDSVSREDLAAPDWRRRVVYVGAESGWWLDRAIDHFAKADLGAAERLAVRLGIAPERLAGSVGELSTGERQRMSLIRALVLEPPVLLLDEPTGPLDPLATERVEAVLTERLAAGTSIVIVTHDVRQAQRLNAKRYVMADGKLAPAS